MSEDIVYSIFLIFAGATLFSTAVLFARQSLMVAYMLIGIVLGPFGLGKVTNFEMIQQTGDVGIIFLLFLLGLHLDPQNLLQMLKKATLVGLVSSLIFGAVGYGVALYFGYSTMESVIVGAAMMFSSTIIALKLLPTKVLHHQHVGELMISILLLQDLMAIIVLLWLQGAAMDHFDVINVLTVVLSLPALILFTFLVERYVLTRLFNRFDRVREYLFLLSIGWCLSVAQLAEYAGLTHEVGAFVAGVSIASSPISLYIAEALKPVRDFFLVMFFFSVGAQFNWHFVVDKQYWPLVTVPALLLVACMQVGKPFVFKWLLCLLGEREKIGFELGSRLGQVSEFSILIAAIASRYTLIGDAAAYLIQAVTMLSFMISSYWVVIRYPTPIALNDQVRRD